MLDDLGWVDVVSQGDKMIVRVQGEVDISNVDRITVSLDEATADRRGRHFVDLSDTRYIDSSAIRMLFGLADRLKNRRQELFLIVPQGALTRRVLELSDLPATVPFLSSVAEIA